MTDSTARLHLPLLHSGQAQKEIAHNEALALLDAVVQASVEAIASAPPGVPVDEGLCWIVGSGATGEWLGRENQMAIRTSGGWRFVAPFEGMAVFDAGQGLMLNFYHGGWEVGQLRGAALYLNDEAMLAGSRPLIANPSGGVYIDAEARIAIGAIIAALQDHGLLGS
jgi:Protein of unknown function (DUF2793)